MTAFLAASEWFLQVSERAQIAPPSLLTPHWRSRSISLFLWTAFIFGAARTMFGSENSFFAFFSALMPSVAASSAFLFVFGLWGSRRINVHWEYFSWFHCLGLLGPFNNFRAVFWLFNRLVTNKGSSSPRWFINSLTRIGLAHSLHLTKRRCSSTVTDSGLICNQE